MKLKTHKFDFASLIILATAVAILEGCGGLAPYERQMGRLLDDKVTVGRVQSALTNNASYNFSHVAVAATNGTVTLSGYVQNEAQRQQAAALAQSVDQVKNVENGVQLFQAPSMPISKPSITGTSRGF